MHIIGNPRVIGGLNILITDRHLIDQHLGEKLQIGDGLGLWPGKGRRIGGVIFRHRRLIRGGYRRHQGCGIERRPAEPALFRDIGKDHVHIGRWRADAADDGGLQQAPRTFIAHLPLKLLFGQAVLFQRKGIGLAVKIVIDAAKRRDRQQGCPHPVIADRNAQPRGFIVKRRLRHDLCPGGAIQPQSLRLLKVDRRADLLAKRRHGAPQRAGIAVDRDLAVADTAD